MADRLPLTVPILGESITEATVGRWLIKVGDFVQLDETIVELETDKVTVEVNASSKGVLESMTVTKGETAKIGDVLGYIDPDKTQTIAASVSKPVESKKTQPLSKEPQKEIIESRRLEKRVPLSPLRLRIAERLKESQNTAAILTTFNEVDLSAVQNLRQRYKDAFEKKHGVKLGLTSFFVKATVQALQEIPLLNSQIDGNDIVHKNYYDIGIAVASPQGLVVPILRDADQLDYAGIEKAIADFSDRSKNNKLTLQDLSGGTFSITNGGVFGSLLSTPILNPPQSGILGLHKIQDRPVAINGRVEIRPMMYTALSYDHRLIDGKDAVTFLVLVKEFLENPGKSLLGL
ncbi:dihydrolipoyllysine-residue succinyltransferase [Candidatus Finniella inopinata]|uniref:Dihydrolipoyllysine-residue succinyltransferase n=1 Tax=Candidatus Finniella inopinata TaxID=1696036 RepID=A0A4Q7DKC8_9PROT|nr:dihydrolipoyllysine-residue succinyltransferase [Candidatus Finniella inopinata]RZI46840.1 dihydrolipoyllysine-residue succinyltransferase [Candidatus Finniella inopinata]